MMPTANLRLEFKHGRKEHGRKGMNPALLWIDILVIAGIVAAYLANLPRTPGIPSSSYYLNGKGPKP